MSGSVAVGLVGAHGAFKELGDQLADDLPRALGQRHGDTEWQVCVREVGAAEPSADSSELFESVRGRLLTEGWDLALGLTQLPLRSGKRPITAEANPQRSVGLVSIPALGGVRVRERLCKAAVEIVERLAGGESGVRQLASPLANVRANEDGSVRFVGAAVRGNLRLLAGTIRANEPTRVITRLSRALAGALGTAAFALASSNVWTLADGMGWSRLVGLTLLATVATSLALILAHGLWEHTDDPRARERVIVFNLATVITIAMGVIILYAGLFAVTALGAVALIPPDVFHQRVGHEAAPADFLQLAWFVTTLATIGGALGSLMESDLSVRNAAQRSTEVAEDDRAARG